MPLVVTWQDLLIFLVEEDKLEFKYADTLPDPIFS